MGFEYLVNIKSNLEEINRKNLWVWMGERYGQGIRLGCQQADCVYMSASIFNST